MNSKVFDPDEATLRLAWEMRRRHGWPHTFEETMENPILHRIIVMTAKHGLHPKTDRRERVSEAEAMKPHKVVELPPYDPAQDRKRLAGGDKD